MATVLATVTARKESKTTRIALQRTCKVDSAQLLDWITAQRKHWHAKGYTVNVECGPMSIDEALTLNDGAKRER